MTVRSQSFAMQGPSVALVREAFNSAGHKVRARSTTGRTSADLVVDDTYLIGVRAMYGSDTASLTTQRHWWEDLERAPDLTPVMVVRGARGFSTIGWTAWIDLAHLTDPKQPETGKVVRMFLDDFVTL